MGWVVSKSQPATPPERSFGRWETSSSGEGPVHESFDFDYFSFPKFHKPYCPPSSNLDQVFWAFWLGWLVNPQPATPP